ncbi:flavin reductase family protein [Modestobacter sp. SYSU DS0290]
MSEHLPAPRSAEVSADALRGAFGAVPTGVVAVGGLVHGALDGPLDGTAPLAMVASTFTGVSLDPPLVSLCVQHGIRSWPALRGLPRLGISVLAEGQGELARRLASRRPERFDAVDWTATADGALRIEPATAWFDCAVESELPAGDHLIVLLRVLDLDVVPGRAPLIWHGSAFAALG